MISPVGSLITSLDTRMLSAADGITAAMSSAVAAPLAVAVVIFYSIEGIKLANGDPSPFQDFWPRLIRISVVLWLATNLTAFNYYVRDLLFTGLPNALTAAVTLSIGGTNTTNAVGAAFDSIYAQLWVIVSSVWSMATFSVMGALCVAVAFVTALAGALGLGFMGLLYIGVRLFMVVMICLAPVLIGCGIFAATRPLLERAIGKLVALIIMQVGGFIVLEIIILIDQQFMVQISNDSLLAIGGQGTGIAAVLQDLVALIVMFVGGAWALLNVYKVAYSIGTGVALSGPSLLSLALLSRGGGGGGGGSSANAAPPLPSGGMSLSIARPALSGGSGQLALPPPPPPALNHSTRS